MIFSDVRDWTRFGILYGKYRLLRKVGNTLVWMHVATKPTSATGNILNNIVQEEIEQAVRRVEFRCHTLKEQYTQLGKEILQ